jgi:uncharacterized protein (TIGR03086 family)
VVRPGAPRAVDIMGAMSEIADRYGRISAGFTTRVVNVSPDQWVDLTPCPDWTVRDLVAHVIGTQRGVVARVSAGEPAEVDRDGDLLTPWLEACHAITEVLGDPTRAAAIVGGMFGEQPFETLVGRLVCTDLLVHTWDLARATGQDDRLDPGALSMADEFLSAIDDAIRVPGGFAEKITPAPGADDQSRFLNFCGRAA